MRVIGKNTDLSFSVEGRKWQVADGKINMPDGEITTSPVENTVEGEIYFEFPGVLGGRLVHDIYLRVGKRGISKSYPRLPIKISSRQ